jgi:hypothetical protein
MDQNVRRFTGVGAVCSEEITTRVGGTQSPSLRTPIAAEPLNKRPCDSHMSRDSGRHLRLVPDPAAAATIAAAAPVEQTTAVDGLGSVTHLANSYSN